MKKAAKSNSFTFSTLPEVFKKQILAQFTKTLDEMQKITDLEPKILQDLYKAQKNEAHIKVPMKPKEKPVIPDPKAQPRKLPDENKWVWDLHENLS